MQIFLIVIYAAFGSVALILLKLSGASFGSFRQFFLSLGSPIFLTGIFLYATSFALWIYIVSISEVHISYPIAVGLTVWLLAIGSMIFLGKNIGVLEIVGMGLILGGVFFLSR